ncbi:hypothetical protein Hanom_Chr11g01000771 [Helianthus anomalus]
MFPFSSPAIPPPSSPVASTSLFTPTLSPTLFLSLCFISHPISLWFLISL